MAPSRFVTLDAWARSTFGEAAPCINTLRRWAREARIYPRAVKAGRTYFVQPDAHYVDTGAMSSAGGGDMRPGGLVARLMRDGRKAA